MRYGVNQHKAADYDYGKPDNGGTVNINLKSFFREMLVQREFVNDVTGPEKTQA